MARLYAEVEGGVAEGGRLAVAAQAEFGVRFAALPTARLSAPPRQLVRAAASREAPAAAIRASADGSRKTRSYLVGIACIVARFDRLARWGLALASFVEKV